MSLIFRAIQELLTVIIRHETKSGKGDFEFDLLLSNDYARYIYILYVHINDMQDNI